MRGLIGVASQHGAITRAFFTHARLLRLLLAALGVLRIALLLSQRRSDTAQFNSGVAKHTLLTVNAGGNGPVGSNAPPIGIRAGVDTASIGWRLGVSGHSPGPDGSYHIQTQFCM